MGSLGWQETLAIFILALILFGPKKLPELGRTLGKAITEFRRASSELRSSFDREMRNLEQETAPIKQAVAESQYDTYNYDYSAAGHYDHAAGESEFTASHPQLTSASAPEGAESTTSFVSPEGTVAYGANTEAVHEAVVPPAVSLPEHPAASEHTVIAGPATEHKA
ncbi:MAG: twin-arginine translocase TatA/TatE family subunit [Acidobacteriia bacterium]|nr:twin-arginine translocase TatA/TatE family subunit [Terriglobia bacterium]